MLEGPVELGIGIFKGTESLIRNTVQGASSSISGFTSAVGDGISKLTFD